jgi:hypothetical protein
MPFGFAFYTFLKNNPVVLYIGAAFAAIATFLSWQRLRDMRIRREARKKIEAEAEKTADKVIQKAEEKTHDVIAKADEARASIPRGTPSGELPKSTQSVLFGDD